MEDELGTINAISDTLRAQSVFGRPPVSLLTTKRYVINIGNPGTVGASATSYARYSGVGSSNATSHFVLPRGGTITRIVATNNNSQPASGNLVLTLQYGSTIAGLSDTSMTLTFSSGDGSGAIKHTTGAQSAADYSVIAVKMANAATATSTTIISISIEIEVLG